MRGRTSILFSISFSFMGFFLSPFFSSFPSHLSFYSLVYLSYDFSCFPILPFYLFSFCLSFINNSFPKFVPSPSPFCILPHHIISFSFPLIFHQLFLSIHSSNPPFPLFSLSLTSFRFLSDIAPSSSVLPSFFPFPSS